MKSFSKPIILIIFAVLLIASSSTSVDSNGFEGDPFKGGKIYDNWMTALDLKPPLGDQPLWASQNTNSRNGDVTWRCKECHGWDYKGADGAFGLTSFRYTGFLGLSGSIGDSHEEVLAQLDGSVNPEHNFLSIMNPNAINDLVAFIRTMQIDTALIIDYESGQALGDEETGQGIYEIQCAECHGVSGRKIDFSASGSPLYMGDIAIVDPWRALHKIRFGTAIENMPSGERLGWSLREIANVLKYAQSLPRGNPNYAISRDISEELDRQKQGDVDPIIWAVVAMLSVIVGGVIWDQFGNKG